MFHITSSKIAIRVIPRVAIHRASSPLVNNVVLSSHLRASSRRAFHDWGSPIPEPEFSPGENMLLDVTAWFVAVALVYTPGNEFDEFDDVEHNQHKSRKQSNRLRAEKENSTECQEDSDTKTSGGHREEN